MAAKITQCPKCHISFRVTDRHLQSANGSVRCGSCLHIFNALDHIAIPDKTRNTEDELLISDGMVSREDNFDYTEEFSPEFTRATASGTTDSSIGSNLFERTITKSEDNEPVTADDSWALDLLKEDDDDDISFVGVLPATNKQTSTDSEDDLKVDLDVDAKVDINQIDHTKDNVQSNQEDDTQEEITAADAIAPVTDDLDSIEAFEASIQEDFEEVFQEHGNNEYENLEAGINEPEEITHKTNTPAEPSEADDLPPTPSYNTEKFQIISEEELDGPSSDAETEVEVENIDYSAYEITDETLQQEAKKSIVTPGLSAQFLDAYESDKVPFSWTKPSSWRHSKSFWMTLSIFSAIVLFGQYAWLNIDTLGQKEKYRPYYAFTCQYLGCELPALKDYTKITTSHIKVGSSSRRKNALKVDFIIQNSAYFQQFFPPIELSFTDHNEKLIASRCFQPSEYLGGEMSGKRMMPIKQPIHIAIEIADPGKEASGYKIGICP